MKITEENIPSYRIAYIRRVGPYGADNMQTMERLKQWARVNSLLNDESIIFGIAQDNPAATKPENCRYDTCIVVTDEYLLKDSSVCLGKISGGKYAVFQISHTAEAVRDAWTELFPQLFEQHYQFDETRPILERYAASMIKKHLCEICVPIL